MKKRILVGLIAGVMLIGSVSVSAASYSDVKETDWFYNQVMAMTEKGLFEGKGDNLFCPNDTMTRAEFLAVVSRMLYPDYEYEFILSEYANEWWIEDYWALIDNGVIDFDLFGWDLETNISREEMAHIAAKGEDFSNLDLSVKIPDINFVSEDYRLSVTMVYDAGVIVGDENGNFNPQKTLTRAEASTALYRLIETSARVIPDKKPVTVQTDKTINSSWQDSVIQNTGVITINEGEKSVRRIAQEGDIVVKADGTKVVLKKGPNGILGEGQWVAADLGMQQLYNGAKVTVVTGDLPINIFGYEDSTGDYIKNQKYRINQVTGEGHWDGEWEVIKSKYAKPSVVGTFEGELSDDTYWVWLGHEYGHGQWAFTAHQSLTDAGVKTVQQLNGIK